MANIGKITQIIGPVVDVGFKGEGSLPQILDALEVTRPDGQKIILECQQHLGQDRGFNRWFDERHGSENLRFANFNARR
jgi:F0F1-type ATP synthase beta subunit